jgi:hypothetical protein
MRSNLAGMERRLHAETFTGDPLRTRDVLDDIEELLRMIE